MEERFRCIYYFVGSLMFLMHLPLHIHHLLSQLTTLPKQLFTSDMDWKDCLDVFVIDNSISSFLMKWYHAIFKVIIDMYCKTCKLAVSFQCDVEFISSLFSASYLMALVKYNSWKKKHSVVRCSSVNVAENAIMLYEREIKFFEHVHTDFPLHLVTVYQLNGAYILEMALPLNLDAPSDPK